MKRQSKLITMILFAMITIMAGLTTGGLAAESLVFSQTYTGTAGTTETLTMSVSGTLSSMYVKIPAADESVRFVFEDQTTGYRFITATQTASASAITKAEIDLSDVKFSGSFLLKIYCNRSTLSGNITTVVGKIIYE